jgi:hypothetical protein
MARDRIASDASVSTSAGLTPARDDKHSSEHRLSRLLLRHELSERLARRGADAWVSSQAGVCSAVGRTLAFRPASASLGLCGLGPCVPRSMGVLHIGTMRTDGH